VTLGTARPGCGPAGAGRAALMGAEVPLADPAGAGADPAAGLLDHRFDARGLSRLRAVVLAYAVEAGMPENRARDVMLAAHELAANAVSHGAGAGRLQLRAGHGMLRVQVHDAGPAGTAGLDGQDIPGDSGDGGWPHRPGHGLWLVRRVADQMSVWRGPGGPVVTAAFALPAAGAPPAPGGGAGC
jgi:anti-sigma regulatory factor (Ser/Thr protein kinase)